MDKKYFVYTITTPDGMIYTGRSGIKPQRRFCKNSYEKTSLGEYIKLWGWSNLKKEIINDCLTKEESYKLEDYMIRFCKINDVCINSKLSGGLCCDGDERPYQEANRERLNKKARQWTENNTERRKEISNKYYNTHKEQHKERCKKWYEEHKDRVLEKQRERRHLKKIQQEICNVC